jgi:hypothetical protein
MGVLMQKPDLRLESVKLRENYKRVMGGFKSVPKLAHERTSTTLHQESQVSAVRTRRSLPQ